MSIAGGPTRAVIPAAGLGSRFLPTTLVVPKELLPLGGLPLIHHALLEVERAGFDEAIVVISPRKRAIHSYFEGDAAYERTVAAHSGEDAVDGMRSAQALAERLHLRFVEKETRGPGEAALLASRLTGDDSLAVLLPDDVVPTVQHWEELLSIHQASAAPTLCVRRFKAEDARRYGVAVCKRERGLLRVHHLVEKPDPGTVHSPYRVFGRYIVTTQVVEALELRLHSSPDELQLTDGLAACIDAGTIVNAVEFRDAFYDCGTPSDYAQSQARVDALHHAARPSLRLVKGGV